MKKYNGKDFSGNWKVVSYEGKTISYVTEKGRSESLVGFDGYSTAAQAAKNHGGIPVRE